MLIKCWLQKQKNALTHRDMHHACTLNINKNINIKTMSKQPLNPSTTVPLRWKLHNNFTSSNFNYKDKKSK